MLAATFKFPPVCRRFVGVIDYADASRPADCSGSLHLSYYSRLANPCFD